MAMAFDLTELQREWEEAGSDQPFWKQLLVLLIVVAIPVAIAIAIAVGLIFAWPYITEWFRDRVADLAALSGAARVAAAIILALVGGLLFLWRQTFRRSYGVSELGVGLFGCWATLTRNDPDRLALALGIAGSVYIIVRGLDNIWEGDKKVRKKERLRAFQAQRTSLPK